MLADTRTVGRRGEPPCDRGEARSLPAIGLPESARFARPGLSRVWPCRWALIGVWLIAASWSSAAAAWEGGVPSDRSQWSWPPPDWSWSDESASAGQFAAPGPPQRDPGDHWTDWSRPPVDSPDPYFDQFPRGTFRAYEPPRTEPPPMAGFRFRPLDDRPQNERRGAGPANTPWWEPHSPLRFPGYTDPGPAPYADRPGFGVDSRYRYRPLTDRERDRPEVGRYRMPSYPVFGDDGPDWPGPQGLDGPWGYPAPWPYDPGRSFPNRW